MCDSDGTTPKASTVILGELVPYETAFGVERLGRLLGVPWVADLQDPWALDEMWLYPSVIHRLGIVRGCGPRCGTAAAVVMNTPEAAARLHCVPGVPIAAVVSIPNGFDADDFAGHRFLATMGRFASSTPDPCTPISGFASEDAPSPPILGGMPVPGVDFLPRSHVFLLEAVDAVTRSDPALRSTIEVHLVGVASAADRAAAAAYPFVRFHGYDRMPSDLSVESG